METSERLKDIKAIDNVIGMLHIWGSLEGDVCIIGTQVEIERSEIVRLPDEYRRQFRDLRERIAFEPDMTARRFMQILLSLIYGFANVRYYTPNEVDFEAKEIQASNLILLGGPLGNLVTKRVMEEYAISEAFFHRDGKKGVKSLVTRKEFETIDDGETTKIYQDHGIFFKLRNLAADGRYVFILAGFRSPGTQGAAACATICETTNEIYRYLVASGRDPAGEFKVITRVRGKEGARITPFDKNLIQIVDPFEGKEYPNVESVYASFDEVLKSGGPTQWWRAIDTLRGRDRKRNEILRQAIEYLQKFRESLGTPEAAMYIHLAKKKLEESWEFITGEDQEVRLTLSAVEGAIRQQKWRDYRSHQIAELQAILQECIDGKLLTREDVLKRISTLHKQNIDIFPSAPEWAYEEDDETE